MKPREFWIHYISATNLPASLEPGQKIVNGFGETVDAPEIHVIEYKAYRDIQKAIGSDAEIWTNQLNSARYKIKELENQIKKHFKEAQAHVLKCHKCGDCGYWDQFDE